MTFYAIMTEIIALSGGISAWFFRRGGIYNPPIAPGQPPILPPDTSHPTNSTIPTSMTQSTPQSLPEPSATLTNMCLAIKKREGANPANNNPGNCRYYSGGYLVMYGKVGISPGGFAMFSTYALGWLYLQNLVKSMIHQHPDRTLLDFFNVYAPVADKNDPVSYSQDVAKAMGVTNSFRTGDIHMV